MNASSLRELDRVLTGMNRRNFMRRLTGNLALAAGVAEVAGIRARASRASLHQAASTATPEADYWARICTSPHHDLSCALLGFTLPNLKNQDVVDTLLARHGGLRADDRVRPQRDPGLDASLRHRATGRSFRRRAAGRSEERSERTQGDHINGIVGLRI